MVPPRWHHRAPHLSQFLNLSPSPPIQRVDNPPIHAWRIPRKVNKCVHPDVPTAYPLSLHGSPTRKRAEGERNDQARRNGMACCFKAAHPHAQALPRTVEQGPGTVTVCRLRYAKGTTPNDNPQRRRVFRHRGRWNTFLRWSGAALCEIFERLAHCAQCTMLDNCDSMANSMLHGPAPPAPTPYSHDEAVLLRCLYPPLVRHYTESTLGYSLS